MSPYLILVEENLDLFGDLGGCVSRCVVFRLARSIHVPVMHKSLEHACDTVSSSLNSAGLLNGQGESESQCCLPYGPSLLTFRRRPSIVSSYSGSGVRNSLS